MLASEFLENLEAKFPLYHLHCGTDSKVQLLYYVNRIEIKILMLINNVNFIYLQIHFDNTHNVLL